MYNASNNQPTNKLKTKVKSTPIIASEGLEQSIMGMDNHGRDMATYFLRDKIYSNKIQAVVREYICNAVDEHKKHGVDRPVEVSMTGLGIDQAVFSVRDHAKGLSDDGVRKIFGMYFKSTKSETNDSIGGFGVGSKAGHAYTDTFNIISHYEGVKTSYSCMLGAGDNNVPVGHIYKLDSCPTDETGIEINLEVKPTKERTSRYSARELSDVDKFKRQILKFVQYAHSPITANIFDEVYNTPKQRHTEIIDGFTISIVDKFTTEEIRSYDKAKIKRDIVQDGYQAKFKMGDVTYGEVKLPDGSNFQDHTIVTVTAPMGSMDIPISREGMESTEKNNRLKERAVKAIQTLAEQDTEQFKKKTLIELTDLYMNNITEKAEIGKYFCYRPDFIYSDYYRTVTSIRDHTHSDLKTEVKNVDKEDGKPVLVVIPNNRATDTWVSKVNTWCGINDKKYLCVREGHYSDIHDTFHIKNARKLKMPKTGKPINSAVVWYHARSLGTYTALELHNKNRKENDLKIAKDLEEAKEQNKKLSKTCKDVNILRSFILNPNKTSGTYFRGNDYGYYVGAKGLKKDLAEIGIVDAGSGGSIEISLKKIQADAQNKQEYSAWSKTICDCPWISDRTKAIVKKDNSKSQRIVEWSDSLRKECTLRGRIWAEFVNLRYYYGKHKNLSRHDIKRILDI